MARYFLALRWRLLRNSWSNASDGRTASLVIGTLLGLLIAVAGFALFAVAGDAPPDDSLISTALVGTVITALWFVAPLLYGVDDTLQPAKFALLPLTRRQLTTGLLAASLISVAVVVTLLATSGTVIAAAHHGVFPALVAALGVLLGLAMCLVGSRAVAAAFARLLASRRARDLATLAVFLLAVGAWLTFTTLSSGLFSGTWAAWLPSARALSWTPLAAPYSAWLDAASGHGMAALVKLLIGLAAVLLVLWWWGRLLESAMTAGVTPNRSGRARRVGVPGELVPRLLRRVLPTGPTGAIVARTLRLWVRDTRFRIALVSYLIFPVVIGIAWPWAPTEFVAALMGASTGLSVANTFGYDGSAYATHLLAAVSGRLDLRARMIGNLFLAVPTILVTAVTVGLIRGDTMAIVPAVGAGLAAFGCAAAAAASLSARIPFVPAPPERPFSSPPNGAKQAAATGYGSLLAAIVLSSPVLLLTLAAPVISWLALPLGVLWGTVAARVGAIVGGRYSDQNGPEILAAVTPGG